MSTKINVPHLESILLIIRFLKIVSYDFVNHFIIKISWGYSDTNFMFLRLSMMF